MDWLKNTGSGREKYAETCEKMQKKILAPILDVDTRWNSTYAMLFRALEIRPVSVLYLVFLNVTLSFMLIDFNGFCSRFLNNSSLITQILKIT